MPFDVFPLFFSGEAIYEIGVEDNGLMTGLSEEDLESSLDTLREMARRLGATIQVLRERVVTMEVGTRTVAEVLVRKVNRKNRRAIHCFERFVLNVKVTSFPLCDAMKRNKGS